MKGNSLRVCPFASIITQSAKPDQLPILSTSSQQEAPPSSLSTLQAFNDMELTLQRPVLLEDLAQNFQRLSASLPPDDWDEEPQNVYLRRQKSGILSLQGETTITYGGGTEAEITHYRPTTATNEPGTGHRESQRLLHTIEERGATGDTGRVEGRPGLWTYLPSCLSRKRQSPASSLRHNNERVSPIERIRSWSRRMWPWRKREAHMTRKRSNFN
jgi:hypothetical protein